MQSVLGFLLFVASFLFFIVFFTLWILWKVNKKEQLRSTFRILSLSSLGFMILAFTLIITAPPPEKIVRDITDRGSQITGLKTTEQKEDEEKKIAEPQKVKETKELAEKEDAESVELEKKEKEKQITEQKEQEQLIDKKAEDKAASEKAKVKKSAEEQAAKVVAEKKKAEEEEEEEEENNSVPSKSKKIIYDAFKSGDDNINETITNFKFDEEEKVLMATVKGKDGWSEKSIGLGFYEDSTTVYRELAKDNRITEAWITITFPMKDSYGNVEDEEVMVTWLSRETMDKINWKSFNYQNLLDVADGKRIYPQFVQ